MLTYLLNCLRVRFAFLQGEEGQDLAEYGLIIALVSIALVAALTLLSGNVSTIFSRIGSVLSGATT